MAQSKLVLLFVACLVATLLPFHHLAAQPLSAQPLSAEDAVAQGTLTLDKRYVGVQPLIPGQPMRVVMAFDPQDQQELRRRSGFFVLDGDRLRRFFAGGSLLDNNLAAGNQVSDRAANELVAVIDQPSGEYTVVIYNDTDIPMHFRLSVENGTFPGEASQPSQPAEEAAAAAAIPATSAPVQSQQQAAQQQAAPSPNVAIVRETGGDSIYTVRAGDTLGLIAQTLYGDLSLYSHLCSYNGIQNCNLIEVGRQLRTPPLAQLDGTAVATIRESSPVAPAQNVAASAPGPVGDSYTVAAGDTLGTIAQQLYGDFQRFREICTLNGLGDCNVVSVGQVLRLPAGSNAQAVTPVVAAGAPSQQAADAPSAPATSAAVQSSSLGVVPTLERTNDKSVFLSLWNSTGLLALLETDGPFTLFVPSDAAFAPVLETSLDMWMEHKQVLERILSYHVLLQSFDASGLTGVVDLPTLEGSTLRAERTAGGDLLVNGAQVIGASVNASNGMIYTIDQVLSPPMP